MITGMNCWNNLLGKKIIAYRGYKEKDKEVQIAFILFDDKETYIELDIQDPYTYHDCSSSARTIAIGKSAKDWAAMFNKEGNYAEAQAADFLY